MCANNNPSFKSPTALSRRKFLKLGGAGVAGATLLGVMGTGGAMAQTRSSLSSDFEAASQEHRVPLELLLAIGYVNSRWETPPPEAAGFVPGDIHGMGGHGVMHLNEDPRNDTLGRASELTGIPENRLKSDRSSNILGAAAVLADLQGPGTPFDLDGWYASVAQYSDPLYANQVYEVLRDGAAARTSTGERLELAPQEVDDPQPMYSTQTSADYRRAQWYGAHSNNYYASRRYNGRTYDIDKIVIHVMQGSWSGAISWFQDGRAGVSAHYNVRSSDGFIGQSVHEAHTGYHAGDWTTNLSSIGIEHEGYVSDPSWFTDAMYRSSARLSAYLCKKYRIPIDRSHIIGHHEVPGCPGYGGGAGCHTDPGEHWAWNKYINLVKYYSGASKSTTYSQIVDNQTEGRFRSSGNWFRNTYNTQRYGSSYCAARPSRFIDPAGFKLKIPARGRYTIFARWPASAGYNPRTTYRIRTADGLVKRTVNQRRDGGRWMTLGTHTMRAGDGWFVEVSRRSSNKGWVIADAVRVVKR